MSAVLPSTRPKMSEKFPNDLKKELLFLCPISEFRSLSCLNKNWNEIAKDTLSPSLTGIFIKRLVEIVQQQKNRIENLSEKNKEKYNLIAMDLLDIDFILPEVSSAESSSYVLKTITIHRKIKDLMSTTLKGFNSGELRRLEDTLKSSSIAPTTLVKTPILLRNVLSEVILSEQLLEDQFVAIQNLFSIVEKERRLMELITKFPGFGRASKIIQKIESESKKIEAWVATSNQLSKAGNFKMAERSIEQISNQINKNYALKVLAEELFKRGHIEKSESVIDKILDNSAKNQTWVKISENLIEICDFQGAQRAIEKISIQGFKDYCLSVLGKGLLKLDLFEDSELIIDKIIDNSIKNAILVNLAIAFIEKNNLKKFEEALQKISDAEYKDKALTFLFKKSMASSDFGDPERIIDRMFTQKSKDDALKILSRALGKLGHIEKSKELLKKIENPSTRVEAALTFCRKLVKRPNGNTSTRLMIEEISITSKLRELVIGRAEHNPEFWQINSASLFDEGYYIDSLEALKELDEGKGKNQALKNLSRKLLKAKQFQLAFAALNLMPAGCTAQVTGFEELARASVSIKNYPLANRAINSIPEEKQAKIRGLKELSQMIQQGLHPLKNA